MNRLVTADSLFGTFKVECWDFDDKEEKHQMIGECFVKLEDVKKSQGPMSFELTHVKIKQPGMLRLNEFKFATIPNFVDYLQSGLELNMIAAIDFTGIF